MIELVLATVLSVYDGDTVKVRAATWPGQTVETSVRIDGVDTPELRGKCQAEKDLAVRAKARAVELMPAGSVVRLHNVRRGKYAGRVVATVTADGANVATVLIADGLGRKYDGGKRAGWCE